MSRIIRAVIVASVAMLATIAPSSIAEAGSGQIQIDVGTGWVSGTTTPLFSAAGLVPGQTSSASLRVLNGSSTASDLSLSTSDIIEDENGCTHDETRVDSTCGSTQGELGHKLIFNVYVDPEDDGTFDVTPAWTGTLYDLATPATLMNGLPGSGIAGLKIVMTLPVSSGNETQTDDVDFSFRLTLAGAGDLGLPGQPGSSGGPGQTSGSGPSAGPGPVPTPQGPGSVEVKGVKHTRHPHQSVLHDITDQLPFTGSPTERMVAGALWLLVAGTALTLLARTRRRRTP